MPDDANDAAPIDSAGATETESNAQKALRGERFLRSNRGADSVGFP